MTRQVMRDLGLCVLVIAAATPASMAFGQAPSVADKEFVRKSIEANNAEIAAGHLALAQAGANDVKQFGQTLIRDHTLLNNQMKPLAQQLDVVVAPGQVDPKDEAVANQLKDLRGQQFDQEFIAAMVQGHNQAVQDTQTEASNGQDAKVKEAAAKGLPVIQKHLQTAQKLAQKYKVQTGKQ